MRAIFESIFDIGYLITIFTLGFLILRSVPAVNGDLTARLAGWLAIVLGFGDSFHLIARVWALNTTGVDAHYVSLGYGKLVTALTMTGFYVLLYLLILRRWPSESESRAKNAYWPIKPGLVMNLAVYGAAIIHILLILLPQNQTFAPEPPVSWGIIRNLPFLVLGVILIGLLWARGRHDPYYRLGWAAVTLSYAFYIPVVLWGQSHESVGLLMIPKTLAYIWLVIIGYQAFAGRGAAKRHQETIRDLPQEGTG